MLKFKLNDKIKKIITHDGTFEGKSIILCLGASAKQLNLEKNVMFLGQRNDANELYQAMDVFVLPSLYEGLGMVLIEAQASGLQCVASTEVPQIANITDSIDFLELSENSKKWSDCVINKKVRKLNNILLFKKNGYDIKLEIKKLEKYYLNK